MTSLTITSVLIVIYGALSRHGFVRAIALGGITPAGAALVAGSTAVPTFYFVALGSLLLMVLLRKRSDRGHVREQGRVPAGVPGLAVFLVLSTLITVVAPFFFDGLRTRVPSVPYNVLAAGTLTTSNVAQVVYLTLAIILVALLAKSPDSRPEIIGLVAGGTTLLCAWAYLGNQFGLPFPTGLFDNSPAFKYIQTEIGGAERFRGIFSEPAGLAVSCVVAASYMFSRATKVAGKRRLGALIVAAVAIYLGVISTSATFLVGGIAVIVIAVVVLGLGFISRRYALSSIVVLISPLLAVAGLWFLPVIGNFVQLAIDDKVTSSSFDDRGSLDEAAYSAFGDSLGLGVGLGSSRGSSFFATLLATTGLVGAALFAVSVVALIVHGWRNEQYRPVGWALISVLAVKVVSGPDLSDTSGVLWISLGLLARAAMEARSDASRRRGALRFDSPVSQQQAIRE